MASRKANLDKARMLMGNPNPAPYRPCTIRGAIKMQSQEQVRSLALAVASGQVRIVWPGGELTQVQVPQGKVHSPSRLECPFNLDLKFKATGETPPG